MTLLEVLVALLIASFAIALLSQVLFQVMQVERRLEDGRFDGATLALRMTMLRNAIAGALPVKAGEPECFDGRELGLSMLTAEAPFSSEKGVTYTTFDLVYLKADDRTELRVASASRERTGADSGAYTLFTWPGRRAAFKYRDADGVWHSEWKPTSDAKVPVLPRAVAVETGLSGDLVLIAPIVAFPVPLATAKDVENL